MRRYRSIGELPMSAGSRAVAIGAFDGVHLGHQEIIHLAGPQDWMEAEARMRGYQPGRFPVIVTQTPYNKNSGALAFEADHLVTRGYVQVIADGQGTAWAIGVRDCSVQRRNQKVIEESASPVLAPEQVAEVKASAERLAVAVGYAGAGTVEFLYHPGDKFFAFLEVNTRLQVEHPVTEEVTGIDLVREQFRIANGEALGYDDPVPVGHSFEFRINGEDAGRNFTLTAAQAKLKTGRLAAPSLPLHPY